MYALYLDSVAIVRKLGRPDFFVTFTANPAWPEIQDHLLPRQTAADRPDLVARVFHMKLRALLHDLTKQHVLGRVIAWTWVVEFQKRGLPHAHILLILQSEDKPRTPADIDRRVVAELPDPRTQACLFEIARRCLLHGPCGARNPGAPCMRDAGSCKARYPKDFREATSLLPDTYPLYRRRDAGITVHKNGAILDNRDVVPYSPFLAKRFDAHINVEVVSSIRLVKYMYKYVYKGHDRANIEVSGPRDEIREHIDARYVGPCEAAWRLLQFPVNGSSHSTERLAVHLPHQHIVTFHHGAEAAAAADPRRQRTTLTAWFDLNSTLVAAGSDPHGIRTTLYHDIPLVCCWDRNTRAWRPRKQHRVTVLGRLTNVGPTEGERYYLFLLLLARPGACSYEDLRTVEGRLYDTFQAAAIACNLCESDEHYHDALREVLAVRAAKPARKFLATVLTCCGVADPLALWTAFSFELSEDFRTYSPEPVALGLALHHLNECLQRNGRTNADFGLPLPPAFDAEAYRLRELRAERAFDPQHEADTAARMQELMETYPEQLAAFQDARKRVCIFTFIPCDFRPTQELCSCYDQKQPAVFFVDGPGGSGKSFLFEAFLHYVRGKGDLAVACAWSGLAATLLPGGRTCHARFGLPVPLPRGPDVIPCSVTSTSGKGQLLAQCGALVWDEIATTPAAALDAANACMQDLRQSEEPFGGALVVLGGDFRQTLPVVEHGGRDDTAAAAVTHSALWRSGVVRRLHLPRNQRATLDAAYRRFLLAVGDGALPCDLDVGPCSVALPAGLALPTDSVPDDLIGFVYTDLVDITERALHTPTPEHLAPLAARCILAPRNDHVAAVNDHILGRFPSEAIVELPGLTRVSGGTPEDIAAYPPDYLQSLDVPGLPPSTLRLCPGALVILLRNIDYEAGLCNGTRCLVVTASPRTLDVIVLTGSSIGRRVFLPRIPMSPAELTLPVKIVRRQFPVRLAWAVTINKSQGQSLQRPELRPSCFFAHSCFRLPLPRLRTLPAAARLRPWAVVCRAVPRRGSRCYPGAWRARAGTGPLRRRFLHPQHRLS